MIWSNNFWQKFLGLRAGWEDCWTVDKKCPPMPDKILNFERSTVNTYFFFFFFIFFFTPYMVYKRVRHHKGVFALIHFYIILCVILLIFIFIYILFSISLYTFYNNLLFCIFIFILLIFMWLSILFDLILIFCKLVICLRSCDRLLSPWPVILLHLRMRRNESSCINRYSYLLKLRLIVRRTIRCLKFCDRLKIPWLVILSQLRMRRNESKAIVVMRVTSWS